MQEQGFGKLNIIAAVYGLKNVTSQVSSLVTDGKPQTLSFTINNKVIGEDGWTGQRKSITVVYNYDGGDLHTVTAKEDDTLTINPYTLKKYQPPGATTQVSKKGISVLAASYGADDVTYKIKNLVSPYNTLSFRVDNTIFGDTWYGIAKTLVIVLGSGDEVSSIEIFTERELCYIDLNDVIPAV